MAEDPGPVAARPRPAAARRRRAGGRPGEGRLVRAWSTCTGRAWSRSCCTRAASTSCAGCSTRSAPGVAQLVRTKIGEVQLGHQRPGQGPAADRSRSRSCTGRWACDGPSCPTGRSGVVIAIDGPSGTGKSTVARRFARAGGAAYLDTGAMYRVVTLAVLRAGLDASTRRARGRRRRAVGTAATRARTRDAPCIELDGADVEAEIRGGRGDAAGHAGLGESGGARPAAWSASASWSPRRCRDRMVVEGRDIGTRRAAGRPAQDLSDRAGRGPGRRGGRRRTARPDGSPTSTPCCADVCTARPTTTPPVPVTAARRAGRRGARHGRAERGRRARPAEGARARARAAE